MARISGLDIAYLHYGAQSGVTPHMVDHLTALGYRMTPLPVPGPLEPRDASGRWRWSWQLGTSLAASAWQFGLRHAIGHRWNTTYAFDVHSRHIGALLRSLARPPDLVVQNGALCSPGLPPPYEYALFLDHTRQLSMNTPVIPSVPPAPDYGPEWRARETAVYRGARMIAVFSRHVAESLLRDYGVAADRIRVVGAGANVYPEKVERRDDGETILFVGKDFRRKGGPVLVRAFERVRRRRPTARLVIAGPAEQLRLPDGAFHRGYVPPDQLSDLFAEATVFALPTLREPFGIAFLDAMACGIPCVGTAIEAVPEIIEHEVTGLLVPAGDDAALAEALQRLLEDPPTARAMGMRGRRRIDAELRWEHVARRMNDVLLTAAGRAASPSWRAGRS